MNDINEKVTKKSNKLKRISLIEAVPDIEKYWDYEKNEGKTPSDFSRTASDKVWTKCPICGTSVKRNVRYTWEADENGVGHVIHCRTCGKRNKNNSLVSLFPDIKKYWVYEKNEHDPEYYTISSGKKVFVRCPDCGKERQLAIGDTIKNNKRGEYYLTSCPECAQEKNLLERRQKDNNIEKNCPDIHKYWDEKNTFRPNELTLYSLVKIYTHCPTCSDLLYRKAINTFKEKDGVWRVLQCQKCAMREFNSKNALLKRGPVIEECPEIEEWWDYDKNSIGPDRVTRGSHYEAYFKCPACAVEIRRDIHSFIAQHRNGQFLPVACPECGYSSKGDPEDNLVKLCPDIIKWWDYEKNAPFKPEQFTKGSQFFAHMKCPDCGLELYTGIHSLLHTNDDGTVVVSHQGRCRKYKAIASKNNLVKQYPQIIDWWDYEKNGSELPEEYTLYSPKKIHFKCPECGSETHRRITDAFAIGDDGTPNLFKCSYCSRIKPIRGFNSLAALYPEIAAQCISTEDTERIFPSALSRMEWKCPDCGNTWFAIVKDRVNGEGCPYCENRRVIPGVTSLDAVKPELTKEWSPNNVRDISEFFPTSAYRALWVCPECKGEYRASINSREIGDDACPYCAGRKVIPGVTSLEAVKPELLEEWSPNNVRDISEFFPTSTYRALWKCPACSGEYRASINSREIGDDSCPYCAETRVLPGYNSFKVKHQDLVEDEWADIENTLIGVDPDKILDSYSERVWWKCPICNKKYMMSVKDRIMKQKRGHNPCIFCNGRRWKKIYHV